MERETEKRVLSVLETLIGAENRGGRDACDSVRGHLDDGFVITRGPRMLEQSKTAYLENLGSVNPGSPLRWLDLAEADADLIEPSRKGAPYPGSGIRLRGDTAIARAIVTTRSRDPADPQLQRFRNIFVLVRHGDRWLLWLWQTAGVEEGKLVPWADGAG